MIEPNSNQIIKNYYKGTIDLPTARTLLNFIKGYPQFRRRLDSDDMNSLNNLEKIEMPDEDYFNLLVDLFLTERREPRETAGKLLFENFPERSIKPIIEFLKDDFSRFPFLLVLVFDKLWYTEKEEWKDLRGKVENLLKKKINRLMGEGVIHDEAVILALLEKFTDKKFEKPVYDRFGEIKGGSLAHFKLNRKGRITVLYMCPHSDPRRLYYIPKDIDRLVYLKELRIENFSLEIIPASIGTLHNLKHLNLNSNHIKGIPDSIGKLKNLRHIDLSYNCIKKIPESIGLLKNLRFADLTYNRIRRIPESIGQLKKLKMLYLQFNEIEKIPDSIGKLVSLKELNLHMNKIEIIPKSMSNLVKLNVLLLDGNRIESIPEEIKNLKNLENLGFGRNNLDKIPEWIGKLGKLRSLDFSNNEIKELPDSITQLKSLEFLDLRNTKIISIPRDFHNLTSLRRIHIENLLISEPDREHIEKLLKDNRIRNKDKKRQPRSLYC